MFAAEHLRQQEHLLFFGGVGRKTVGDVQRIDGGKELGAKYEVDTCDGIDDFEATGRGGVELYHTTDGTGAETRIWLKPSIS